MTTTKQSTQVTQPSWIHKIDTTSNTRCPDCDGQAKASSKTAHRVCPTCRGLGLVPSERENAHANQS